MNNRGPYKGKTYKTPYGDFKTLEKAAIAHEVSRQYIHQLIHDPKRPEFQQIVAGESI